MSENRIDLIKEKLSITPSVGEHCWIAPGAVIVGDVTLGNQCTILFGAVLRGDTDFIRIGNGSNVQDNAVIHADPSMPTTIGQDCIIGHSAIVHGATLGNRVLVGMHATVLNGAKVGNDCIIGANCLVPEGMDIPDGSLVVGIPARIIKSLNDDQKQKIIENAQSYQDLGKVYRENFLPENHILP